jgi:hypothetical protein
LDAVVAANFGKLEVMFSLALFVQRLADFSQKGSSLRCNALVTRRKVRIEAAIESSQFTRRGEKALN